jgi:hypothetical protein
MLPVKPSGHVNGIVGELVVGAGAPAGELSVELKVVGPTP